MALTRRYRGKSKTERIDIENPAPGERPGQIHYHEPIIRNGIWMLMK